MLVIQILELNLPISMQIPYNFIINVLRKWLFIIMRSSYTRSVCSSDCASSVRLLNSEDTFILKILR